MLHEVLGDLVNDEEFTVFCHQTNCQGVMGSGIAKQIAKKYPVVLSRHKDYCKHKVLGSVLPVRVSPTRICVNIYGQDQYGTDKRYTDYDALKAALNELAERLQKAPAEWPVCFPYKMGCGLGGGSWRVVLPILDEFSEKVKQNVFIVHLPPGRRSDG